MQTNTTGVSNPRQGPEPIRLGAKALIATDAHVLLVKERHSDGSPFWTLPGGGVKQGETVRQALKRELNEELAAEIVVGERLGAYVYPHYSSIAPASRYTVARCWVCSEPTPQQSEGIHGLLWAPKQALPARALPQIQTMLATLPI